MKKLRFFLPLAALGLLASCANEEVNMPNEPVEPNDGIYLTLSASLPAGTKAGPTVPGADNENVLETADIYIYNVTSTAETDIDGITNPLTLSSTSSGEITKDISSNKYTLKKTLSTAQMKSLLGKKLHIYVIGNKTQVGDITGATPDAMTFTASGAGVTTIKDFRGAQLNATDGKGQKMTFISTKEFEIDLSSLGATDEDLYKLVKLVGNEYIFDISNGGSTSFPTGKGSLDLERALARIDYADLRGGSNTYNVFKLNGATQNYYLKLTSLQIANVNDKSNLFRHSLVGTTSNAPLPSNAAIKLFGEEGSGDSGAYTWIAGEDWTVSGTTVSKTFSGQNTLKKDNLTFGFNTAPTTGKILETELCATGNNRKYTENGNYYVWGYVTENTIPTTAMMAASDLYKYATAIEFTFQVCTDAAGTVPATVASNGNLRITMAASNKYQDLEYKTGVDGKNGYFLKYYGFITHNKDGEAMKYGVVRNNVYQLSINAINNLPDPKDISTMFLQMDVNVLPWTQRLNSFEFNGSSNQ